MRDHWNTFGIELHDAQCYKNRAAHLKSSDLEILPDALLTIIAEYGALVMVKFICYDCEVVFTSTKLKLM